MGTRLRPGQAVVCKRAPVNGIDVHPDEAGAHYTVRLASDGSEVQTTLEQHSANASQLGMLQEDRATRRPEPLRKPASASTHDEWLWIGAKYL